MRKTVLLAAMLSLTVLMFAASPAMSQYWNDGWWNDDWNNDWNEGWWNDGFDFDDGLNQDVEQEAESGDVDQSFDVSGTGDNSNQTVGTQGVANTGNAQNQIGVIDAGGFGDFDGNNDWWNHNNDDLWNHNNNDGGDFEFEDVGSTIELSPTNTTSRDQQ